MAKFKVGDRVLCVDAGQSGDRPDVLVEDRVYVVSGVYFGDRSTEMVYLRGVPESWSTCRFELANPPVANRPHEHYSPVEVQATLRGIQVGEVRTTSSTGAQKGSKMQRFDLIPVEPLQKLAELYGVGSQKYEERNWEKGYDWSLSFAALNRHLWQFWNGEDLDEETGLPHLAAVAWHAFTLLEFAKTHPEFDNRPGKETDQ